MNLKKLLLIPLFSVLTLISCAPPSSPSLNNVKIRDYFILIEYYEEIGNTRYDIYWPELTLENKSNSEATITIRYYFTVCDERRTDPALNKTIDIYVPKGTSIWELDEDYRLHLLNGYECLGKVFFQNVNVEFGWTVLSVS
jgi:hypothetical protein